jgi:hypothetical protein
MSTFESFHDLEKSNKFEDKIIYDFFIKLLDALFGKHDNIIINLECENDKNQQLIKDQLKFISAYFEIPKRVFSTGGKPPITPHNPPGNNHIEGGYGGAMGGFPPSYYNLYKNNNV